MKTVQVLLATYNGSSYLTEQIESLLNQTYPFVSILARDDGSTDTTTEILESYSSKNILSWMSGENIGVKKCFYQLLESAPSAFCYSYCDQDDVWLADKLERAINAIESFSDDTPVLYFTSTTLVDENLNPLNQNQSYITREVGFGNALAQNIVTGCTLVMNHSSRQLILSAKPNWDNIRMHDWWAYQVIAAHGKVIYDPVSSVKYRQHNKNQVGMNNIKIIERLKRFFDHNRIITRQAKELYNAYHDTIPNKKSKMLYTFLSSQDSLLERLQLAFSGEIYRQGNINNLIFKLLLILNRL